MRSTIEIAERLARRLVCNVEAYWATTGYSDDVISIAPTSTSTFSRAFSTIIVDCDKGLSLVLGFTYEGNVVEVPIDQLAVISSALVSPYIRNTAAPGTPNALARVITLE